MTLRNPRCYVCDAPLDSANGCIVKEGRSGLFNALVTCRNCIDAHVLRSAVEGVKACIPEANRMTNVSMHTRPDPHATPPMGHVAPTPPNMTPKRKTLPPDAREFKERDVVVFTDDTRGLRYLVKSFNVFTDDLEIYDHTASGGTRIVDGQDMCILIRCNWRIGDKVIFRDVFEKRGVALIYTVDAIDQGVSFKNFYQKHNPITLVLACILDLDP
jgi:hypothetical protein